MTDRCYLKVGFAQLNLTVGAISANTDRLISASRALEAAGAQVILTPELSICGYPPEDLLGRDGFVSEAGAAVKKLAGATSTVAVIAGAPTPTAPTRSLDSMTRVLHNSAVVCAGGKVIGVQPKRLLPDYDVFDESRWFAPGPSAVPLWEFAGVTAGLLVCEDLWTPEHADAAVAAGAEVLLAINASPWDRRKQAQRRALVADTARRCGRCVAYLNLVGAQDGIVFDGASLVAGADGAVIWEAPSFTQNLAVVDVPVITGPTRAAGPVVVATTGGEDRNGNQMVAPPSAAPLDSDAECWAALRSGLGDYVRKNGFARVWIGLSGGIDSAVVAALAVDELGAAAVTGVMMPSQYSSEGSVTDAQALADRLGIATHILAIKSPFDAITSVLSGGEAGDGPFAGTSFDTAEENIQARIRGIYLMGLSNKFGGIVLSTGNRSEMAVGFSTLYGDSAGGMSPIADVPKTLVYRLARWRNQVDPARIGAVVAEPIPAQSITKAPSAELAPDQVDQNSLPAYPLLDWILERSIEDGATPSTIAAQLLAAAADPTKAPALLSEAYREGALASLDSETAAKVVARVVAMVDRAEYKRRQSAPNVRTSTKAWGRDRRMPITNRWQPAVEVPQVWPRIGAAWFERAASNSAGHTST